MEIHAALPARIALMRNLSVAATLALIALGLAWELWLAPTGRGTLALKVVPLVLTLPGLLRMRLFIYRWMSLLVWLYVTEGLVRATSEGMPGAALAWAEVTLAVLIFMAVAGHIRARMRQASLVEALP